MTRLHLGVIGAGSWAQAAHLPALHRRRDEVEFVAVCRPDRPALHRVAHRYGIGRLEHLSIQMSSTTRELLSDTGSYPDDAADSRPESATWTDPATSGGGYGQAQLSHGSGWRCTWSRNGSVPPTPSPARRRRPGWSCTTRRCRGSTAAESAGWPARPDTAARTVTSMR